MIASDNPDTNRSGPFEALAYCYRERSQMIAFLACQYPAVICANDPNEPNWPVIYLKTPAGQLSWHLSRTDLDLFGHVPQVDPGDPAAPEWDGHTVEEKYERLAALGLERLNRDRPA
jgi:hypothetical protein